MVHDNSIPVDSRTFELARGDKRSPLTFATPPRRRTFAIRDA